MDEHKPVLGITMGDPSGIGPEIVIKAMAAPNTHQVCNPLVIGDAAILEKAQKLLRTKLVLQSVQRVQDADFKSGVINILDQKTVALDKFEYGKVSAMAGRAAFRAIEKAIELAMQNDIAGTVTAPINKESLNRAGYHYAGHTEIYADLTGTRDYAMMLAEGHMRVSHVSTHVSLRNACDKVKKERILKVVSLSNDACKLFGIEKPRVAVAGLNPHSGENGMFGSEEIDEIIPAIEEANSMGIIAEGPVPPDTLFSKLNGRLYDIAVAMYHDQGHIPMKLMGFNFATGDNKAFTMKGVNITLGLPIVRSSVDHGTAFDIAGQGIANQESMLQAVEYGAMLSKNKCSDWRG
jgi:4-hydroxythreonine-4-phosphate dehydrogenase